MFIYKDQNTTDFIDACNMDPAGKLTHAENEYVRKLVNGLKHLAYGSTPVWDLLQMFNPAVGNTVFKARINLKTATDSLIDLSSASFHSRTTVKGLKGQWASSIVHDSSYLNNISCGAYILNSDQTWGGAATLIGNGVGSHGDPKAVQISFRNSSLLALGAANSMGGKPFVGFTAASKESSSAVNQLTSKKFATGVGSVSTNSQASNITFKFNMIPGNLEQSDIEMNCLFVANYMSLATLLQMGKLIENINAEFNRSYYRNII